MKVTQAEIVGFLQDASDMLCALHGAENNEGSETVYGNLIKRIRKHGIAVTYTPMTDDEKSEILNKAVRGDHQSYDSVITRTEQAVLNRLGVAPKESL